MPWIGSLWDSLVDCICRPPRDEYLYPDDLIGGRRGAFRVGRFSGIREDVTLVNRRGQRLACSHFFPKHVRGRDGRLPCVIYCHCNSGSRRDAEEAVCVLIPHGVSVFTLDFAGSGLSDGQWVTLGADEVEDVAAAVEYLRSCGRVSTLGLWGRSMGAVTALLYSQRDPSIAGMVLDSPFSRLTDLMMEIVAEQRLPVPRPLAKLALAAMRRSVSKRANFDITKVAPVDAVPQSFIPALFGHATGDTFIRISHSEALHAAYAGDKNLIRFDGDHNSRRPEFFYNSVSIFWHNTLQLDQLIESEPASSALAPSSSGAAATAGVPASRAGVGIPIIPVRRPQTPSRGRLLPAEGAAAAAGTQGATPAAAAAAPPPGDGGGGGDGAAAEGAAEDVAVTGTARRSAPWEPRMWEWDLDRADREKQRFRRMAGGLNEDLSHSAGGGGSGGAAAAAADATEMDIARLLAAAGDPSALEALGGAAGGGLLLPGSEEEEEAQLLAALQLSLLEAAGVGDGAAGAASSGGAGAGAAKAAGSRPPSHRPSGIGSGERGQSGRASGSGAAAPQPPSQAAPQRPQSAAQQQLEQQRQQQPSTQQAQQQGCATTPAPPLSSAGDAVGEAVGAEPGAGAGTLSAPIPVPVPAAGAARSTILQEEPRPPNRLPPLPYSGDSTAQRDAQSSPLRQQQRVLPCPGPAGGGGGGGLSAPASGSAWPLPSLTPTPSAGTSPATSTSLPAPHSRSAPLTPPVRSTTPPPRPPPDPAAGGSHSAPPAAMTSTLPPAAVTTAAPMAPPRQPAAAIPAAAAARPEPSLYDLYSEEELLALAMQMSLAESQAAATHGSAS